ncbi:MAG: hypothetical protein H7336_08190 [Bacteriovorax sp.]|nr:hypothetical protein [Bacteriovorax sp.]
MQINIKTSFIALMATTLMGIYFVNISHADETVKEKATEMGNDTTRAVRKGVRKVKDETCKMVNGKMECAAKKVKHKMQNAGDKVKDAVD